MRNELKYFFYIFTIISFIIFVGTYYFSDKNKKNSYRSVKLYNEKINEYKNKLLILNNDTVNIIEYTDTNLNKNDEKYRFWDLFKNDEK